MKRIVLVALAALGTACAHHDATYDPNVGTSTPSTTTTTMTAANGRTGTENSMPDTTPAPAPMTDSTTDRNATPSTIGTARPGDVTPQMNTAPQNQPPANPPVTTNGPDPNARPDADNTGINKRDRGNANPTAGNQGNNKNDTQITAAIRRAVMGDGALSFAAKNVKIITNGGKVMLRGPVKSAQEKAEVEAKTRAVDGVTDVDNQLEVKQ